MQKDLRPAVSTSYSQHIFAYLDIPAGASFFGRAIDVPPRCTLDAARHPVYFGTHVTMNIKKLPSVTVALALLPVAARGQATGSTTQTSSWGNLFWSLIPIIFVVLIFPHPEGAEANNETVSATHGKAGPAHGACRTEPGAHYQGA
jgi:hypothetical protein